MRRAPRPSPRASGSTRSRRNRATVVALGDQQDAADVAASAFSNPAALAPLITLAHERYDDFCRYCLELVVPAIFAAVHNAVAADDPAHVPGFWVAQDERNPWLRAQHAFDRLHGFAEPCLRTVLAIAQQCGDIFDGLRFDRREALTSARRG